MNNDVFVQFIVSEDIENQTNSNMTRNVIINPIHIFRSQFIPTSLSLGVTVLISGLDFSISHTLEVKLTNPHNNQVIFTTNEQQTPLGVGNAIDNITMNLDLNNIPFEHEGKYIIELRIDGDKFTDEFEVLKVEPTIN